MAQEIWLEYETGIQIYLPYLVATVVVVVYYTMKHT
jgi:hypothetical protein